MCESEAFFLLIVHAVDTVMIWMWGRYECLHYAEAVLDCYLANAKPDTHQKRSIKTLLTQEEEYRTREEEYRTREEDSEDEYESPENKYRTREGEGEYKIPIRDWQSGYRSLGTSRIGDSAPLTASSTVITKWMSEVRPNREVCKKLTAFIAMTSDKIINRIKMFIITEGHIIVESFSCCCYFLVGKFR
ncbi:hypothetical protein ACJX0J_009204 [Zea mays]